MTDWFNVLSKMLNRSFSSFEMKLQSTSDGMILDVAAEVTSRHEHACLR